MERIVEVKETKKTKRIRDKKYEYVGYFVKFSLSKEYVERFGRRLELKIDEETGEIRLKPVKTEGRG